MPSAPLPRGRFAQDGHGENGRELTCPWDTRAAKPGGMPRLHAHEEQEKYPTPMQAPARMSRQGVPFKEKRGKAVMVNRSPAKKAAARSCNPSRMTRKLRAQTRIRPEPEPCPGGHRGLSVHKRLLDRFARSAGVQTALCDGDGKQARRTRQTEPRQAWNLCACSVMMTATVYNFFINTDEENPWRDIEVRRNPCAIKSWNAVSLIESGALAWDKGAVPA